MDNILVSIITLAYNHEHFINKCLDGFLMQQTSFNFEVLIHDDASTDSTAAIIQEYENMYPAIFRPIYQTENQFSKGIPIGRTYLYPRARGKYIALCEGDDYWTDPLKLQRQVDYLTSHPECALVFTNATVHWYNGQHEDELFSDLKEGDYSGIDIVNNWIIPTASVVYRKEILSSNLYKRVTDDKKLSYIGDTPLFLTCAEFGTLHYLPYVTCVYGKHDGGFLLGADSKRKIQLGDYRLELYKIFGNKYKSISILSALQHYRIGLWHLRHEKNFRLYIKIILKIAIIYLCHPVICSKRIKQIVSEKL